MVGEFVQRHIGIDEDARARMLGVVGQPDLQTLIRAAVPAGIVTDQRPVGGADSEHAVLAELRALAAKNTVRTSMIGQGYYDTRTPSVIARNVLENPAWYTAYTPYQPEISQGRLEALLNFQTMVTDLTGMSVAGASMLDEATAAAEGMLLANRATRGTRSRFLVDADTLVATKAVLATRADPLGIELVEFDPRTQADPGSLADVFGVLLSYPAASGAIRPRADLERWVEETHQAGALVVVAADLLALTLIEAPGAWGADIVVGTSQRFGVPMGFGGPHAGYLAVRDRLQRQLPGRLVGVSKDKVGAQALRLALQTREQHIRREKATSNICTAQVLLAVIASMYAVYHGPDGLRSIAERIHGHARDLAAGLAGLGLEVLDRHFFDTVTVRAGDPATADRLVAAALARDITLWRADSDLISISCDEVTTAEIVERLLSAVREVADPEGANHAEESGGRPDADAIPHDVRRSTDFLTHPVFSTYRSETSMMRYLRRLSDRDYALDRGMIPLGSCTMKLNAATEMAAITWPEFARIHPFAPTSDVVGYLELIDGLQRWLADLTGYAAVSVQPNAGSQGELAGLLAIRGYHASMGEGERDVCVVPASAHGTNAASAVLAGLRVAVVATAESGDIDLEDLARVLAAHEGRVAAIMVTYPSTHGVYEEGIGEVCDQVHAAGGQVYIDGANLNALVGVASPGAFGGDVSHLNLHKTFCIPHGGGGPGVGPVAVAEHLAPFLPGHPLRQGGGRSDGVISAAPYGSPSILPISWAYIRLMGSDGLREATANAVLSANYVAARLGEAFPVLYRGRDGLVAHECILDLRPLTAQSKITVEDVAKRLIDFGFHAPTMSFPVAGTLMVEPTESEDLGELDRFIDAMLAIRGEVQAVIDGAWPADDNPLVNAPHTAAALVDDWPHPYTRKEAVYPIDGMEAGKYWVPVRRIDGAYGDRNLMCSCPPVSEFA